MIGRRLVYFTVHLTSIYHWVPENQEFALAPTETIVGQVKKMRIPACGRGSGGKNVIFSNGPRVNSEYPNPFR